MQMKATQHVEYLNNDEQKQLMTMSQIQNHAKRAKLPGTIL